jgi:spore maturation protein SpmB
MPLFGFSSPEAIAVPITALGAAGAAIGIVEKLLAAGQVNAHDIAVFTSMCMCWSGYLSTHVAMMDSLKCRELTGKAILYHTIGGICAGIASNWLYTLITLIL